MKLIDLDPRWLIKNRKRVGFTFTCPTRRDLRQSCFIEKVSRWGQWNLIAEQGFPNTQGCSHDCLWVVAGGIDASDFTTLTVTASLDGSKGGMWHGSSQMGRFADARHINCVET